MPRHGGVVKGKGGKSGTAGGGGGKGSVAANRISAHVAKPAVTELPPSLQIAFQPNPIPSFFATAFPEFKKQQGFFSALERLYPDIAGSTSSSGWLGLPSDRLSGVDRGDSRFAASLRLSDGSTQPVFVKRIHLLDPVRAMEGDYVWPNDGALPAPSDLWKAALAKINEPLNEAYVDALFAACASKLVES
jgi:hypothetical protein